MLDVTGPRSASKNAELSFERLSVLDNRDVSRLIHDCPTFDQNYDQHCDHEFDQGRDKQGFLLRPPALDHTEDGHQLRCGQEEQAQGRTADGSRISIMAIGAESPHKAARGASSEQRR
jgi:hypothetical protein